MALTRSSLWDHPSQQHVPPVFPGMQQQDTRSNMHVHGVSRILDRPTETTWTAQRWRQLSSTSRRSPDSSFPLRFPRGAIKLIEPTFHELGRGRAREENTNYPPNEQLATHPASALILNNCVLEQSSDSVIGKFNGKSFFSHLLLLFFFFLCVRF